MSMAERGFYADVFDAMRVLLTGDQHECTAPQMLGLIHAAQFAIERQRAAMDDVLVKEDP